MAPTCRDRAVLLDGTLVVADLHFGKGEASTVEFPLGANSDAVERLEAMLADLDPAEVVLAGDVFHSFEYVPAVASEALAALSRAVRDAGARLVVVRGNHDSMLDSVWDGQVHEEYVLSTDVGDAADAQRTVVCHGHEEPETAADRYVVGHDHPAIVIEGQKRPCFLDGRGVYRGSDVLVVPAFNRLVEGVSVNGRLGSTRPELSPLVTNVGAFRPVVYDGEADETLRFPPLDQFQRML
ncbi:metallophosphoesterase [Halobacteriales archaeon QS_4_69_31]|nr:MAG: metallophosphoesterase [Halobacteriales archaeon QS_4_69_31]